MKSAMSNSQSARLLFWFFWLTGFAMGFLLIGKFIIHITVDNNVQKAIPYFLGFVWQCGVQLFSLKRYQHSMWVFEPLLIQIIGSLVLVSLVGSILLIRN